MKKIGMYMMVVLVSVSILSGCSSNSNTAMDNKIEAPLAPEMDASPNPSTGGGGGGMTTEEVVEMGGVSEQTLSAGTTTQNKDRKVIWYVDMSMETTDFEAATEQLRKLIEQKQGFVENENVGENEHYSSAKGNQVQKERYAYITARIPSAELDHFLSSVGTLCNVTSSQKSRQDVTFQYVDIEIRLKSLRMEQEKLFELLGKAESLDSIIMLEQRLTEVRYEIESYTTSLMQYDDKIAYSTVNMNLREVQRITDQVQGGLGSRISSGFSSTLYNLKIFGESVLVFVVVNIPVFLVLGVLVAIAWVIARAMIRKNRAKMEQDKASYAKRRNAKERPSNTYLQQSPATPAEEEKEKE